MNSGAAKQPARITFVLQMVRLQTPTTLCRAFHYARQIILIADQMVSSFPVIRNSSSTDCRLMNFIFPEFKDRKDIFFAVQTISSQNPLGRTVQNPLSQTACGGQIHLCAFAFL